MRKLNSWIAARADVLLRVSMGIVFIWFGLLKPAGISPAHQLVAETIFWWPAEFFVPLLGWMEVAIGLGLLVAFLRPLAVTGLLLHLFCTFLPLVIVPEACFSDFPFGLTLVGQYIVKNLVFVVVALILLQRTVRVDHRTSVA